MQHQKTAAFLMFVGAQSGKAEQAIRFYISLFKNSELKKITYFKSGEPGNEGTVKHALFSLDGQEYMANDGGAAHQFSFTPAISIYVACQSGEEIAMLYEQLSADGKILMPLGDYGFSKKFGWTEDRYGVSWQLNLEA